MSDHDANQTTRLHLRIDLTTKIGTVCDDPRAADFPLGTRVRCLSDGQIGTIIAVIAPADFGLPDEAPLALVIETDPVTKHGIVRDSNDVEEVVVS